MRIGTTLAILLTLIPGSARAAGPDAPGVAFFEQKIRPALVQHCYSCHSAAAQKANKLKGGLLLDTREGLRKGGDAGPAVVPGKPAEGTLLKALRHDGDTRMPPKGKLDDAVLADFEKWVAAGAPDPRDGPPAAAGPALDVDKGRDFWAFQPPRDHPRPAVRDRAWPLTDLDHFILAGQERGGLTPARPATKGEWIRRVTFDLIGLPPTPEEIDAFARDDSPDAFARVVDRLLASDQYGERWARHWLDLARYTDDLGGTVSPVIAPNAFRYRDWVVRAFNRDMPYDRFVRLQLAGDLVPEPADDYAERLGGLGFQGLGQLFSGNAVGMAKKKAADELDDRTDTVTRALLGLTVSCARCHDHKFDPIPQADYYSLTAAYNGADWTAEVALASPQAAAAAAKWEKEVADLKARLAGPGRQPDDQARLDRLLKEQPPALAKAPGVRGGGVPLRVHLRGDPEKPGDEAPPGFLQVLTPKGREAKPGARFTRLDLADAIARPDNPLTARVWVNRVWMHHFGRGLVGTPSNFGRLGDRPTHPELLDSLAVRFVRAGWSTKWLHREIVLSATYRLGSEANSANAGQDADNHYLWHFTPRRLDFEAWRDAMLAVAGRLDPTVGGPPLAATGGGQLHPEDPAHGRRTLYCFVSRFKPNPTLTIFDFPEPNVTSEKRNATTVPQQGLFALNSPFTLAMGRAFAARVQKAEQADDARVRLAWRLAYGRPPADGELALAREFLRTAADPWPELCQSLLLTNEFAFVN